MRTRMLAMAALAGAVVSLGACASEEGYRQRMALELGRTTDQLLLRWGPPEARMPMSNGREMWSYTRTTVDERGGYYRDETRQVTRKFTDKDGKQKTETIQESYPVWQPPQVLRSTCSTRFVIGEGRVEDVSFEGEGCVAEEING